MPTPNSPMPVLSRVCDRFETDLGIRPCVGAEIEFYFAPPEPGSPVDVLRAAMAALVDVGIVGANLQPETGECQFEITLPPVTSPVMLAWEIDLVRSVVTSEATAIGAIASFAARPDTRQPPSAMHIHVSLIGAGGENLFSKPSGHNEESDEMRHSIAGICEWMNASMVFFAPLESSYGRFHNPHLSGSFRFANAPSTVSWGGNNRTVAVRIPTSTTLPESRHLEHRVPCADADPELAIAAILAAIGHGIRQRLPLRIDKVWGDAGEERSDFPLAMKLSEAREHYGRCEELQNWMGIAP